PGLTSYSLAVGDWNRDGVPDLASADQSNGFLRIYLGAGDGTFVTGDAYAFAGLVSAVNTDDLNGDGVPDLITSAYIGGVSVLLGLGDGTFAQPVDYLLPGFFGSGVAVADLNKDGRLDVVESVFSQRNFAGAMEVYLGNSDGSLQSPVAYPTLMENTGVAIADLNRDGILDLATGGINQVAVLFGKGDGTFAPEQTYTDAGGTTGIAVADLNGDGSPDLLQLDSCRTGPASPCAVAVWANKGDGTFRGPSYYGVGVDPRGFTVGDINKDGHPDVIAANDQDATVSVLLNNGGGMLISRREYGVDLNEFADVGPVAVGYIDRDNNLDAAVVDHFGNRIFVVPGNPNGSFRTPKIFSTGEFPNTVALADVDGDGWTDMVTPNFYNSISVLRGNGRGNFKPHVEYLTGVDPITLTIADINNDGAPDVVAGLFTGHGISTLLNDGLGAFPSHVETYTAQRVVSVAVGDLNKDGFLDVATANTNEKENSFSVLLGNGDGTFAIQQTSFRSSGAEVAIADVNHDGNLDVVLLGDQVIVYPGNGDGTFKQRIVNNTGQNGFLSGLLGDFNGDGKLDAAITGDAIVLLSLGNGDGTFQLAQTYSIGGAALAAGDFNRDGALDLMSAGSCCIDVLLNTGVK
ncbi:MAG: VCBS repeat-containing protein, partial [Acidobacteriales bacterium]|nr:VCBS repeat-containing protein [Terriglobales bacterium]